MSWQRIWRLRLKKIKNKFFNSEFSSKRINKAKIIKFFAFGCFLGTLLLFFGALFLFAWYAKDLPRPDKIVRKEGFATKIFDRQGVLLYDVYADQRRIPVTIDQIPLFLRQATIAIEDKNFYQHQGFDLRGWLRAVYNIVFKRRLEGGSTLTQQLVKNVLLSPQRTLGRKIKEFVLAIQIEKKYSKDEILQMYLNEAPYGGTAWGIEAAAETYFDKKVSELNLVESAILAGLPQRPSYYSPFGENPKAYIERTKNVLRRMREDGYISKEKEEEALKQLEEVKFASPSGKFKAPHFVMYVKKILEEKYGEKLVEQGGLKIYTTLNWELQQKAESIVKEEIAKVEKIHITNGAALVMDVETGEILAMVGSKDYFAKNYDGQVNVVLSLRQPGSAIKPVTYVTALKKGYPASLMIVDALTHFPGGNGPDYVPKNYDNKVRGPVQLRYALGNSLNIPSVKLLALVGIKDMLTTASEMGLTTLAPTSENISRLGLSVTLGGGEVRLLDLTAAYSAFANGGFKISPVAILKVEDQKGKVLEQFRPVKGKQVLTPQEAFIINDILADNNARLLTFGANSLLNIPGRKVAVKTGTTNDMRDNWTIGWDPKFIVGVWVGNNDNSPMKQVASGISGASPIWRRIILEVLKKEPIRDFPIPPDIEIVEVDQISGYPSHDGFPSRKEYFIKGTVPLEKDPIHTKLKVCRSDPKKLAPDTLVFKGEYEEKEFIILKEKDPLSSDKNRWQEGIDAWIASQTDERFHYPQEYCEIGKEVIVKIKKPEDKERIETNEVEIEAEVIADNDIKKVEFYANDILKESLKEKPYKIKLVLEKGIYRLKVKAEDINNLVGEKEITVGIQTAPIPSPSPSFSPLPSLSPSPSPSVVINPSPSVLISPSPSI